MLSSFSSEKVSGAMFVYSFETLPQAVMTFRYLDGKVFSIFVMIWTGDVVTQMSFRVEAMVFFSAMCAIILCSG